ERIKEVKGVVGIVYLGGLTREYADYRSDIDITAFTRNLKPDLIGRLRAIVGEEERASGLETDFEIHEFGEFERREWTEIDRWELGNARIVHDPEEKVRALFDRKMTVPEDFWIDRIASCYAYLSWYCCSPRGVPTVAEIWLERGDAASAHHCVSYSVDLFMDLLFALNGQFVPPPKWKLSYCRGLEWLPANFESRISKAMITSDITSKELGRRLRALRSMWPEVIRKIGETTGLDHEGMTRRFVESILKQT
ncbi:MAG: DUF4037 domain-containing protein, partial [Euryarchaeota archaeon]|nr:DUF4037 domain-containing protein [Euryarchaeota archaeon]